MRLPVSVKDRQLQTNFNFLSSRFPGVINSGNLPAFDLSPVRTINGLTMVVGTAGYPADVSGFTGSFGIIVVNIGPSTHWAWNWVPRTTDIVVTNTGAAQTFNFSYIVVGTKK